ncbi:BirA family transcriptional regulator, biotin operon repressor [Strigomonas culicis]|nr:BirA family transcriptional regulator, biotin operon repressor [Strigomonas culicis]|eukprot:EPY31095.1 BirA family transcriptional regulator, biotin operon repressor [Strigomonas culicis]
MTKAKELISKSAEKKKGSFYTPSTPEGEPDTAPFAVVADSQTAGLGTGGRQWISPPGNLYCTLSIPLQAAAAGQAPADGAFALPTAMVPVLSLVCGLVGREAVLQLIKQHVAAAGLAAPDAAAIDALVRTKWPNDIIYNHKKISGSLIDNYEPSFAHQEGEPARGTGRQYLLLGVGVNIETCPKITDAGREATTLNAIIDELNAKHQATIAKITANELAETFWDLFFGFLTDETKANMSYIVAAFEEVMDKSLVLHRRVTREEPAAGGEGTTTVFDRDPTELYAVKLNSWGHLIVKKPDGTEETLLSEYLY